MITVAIPTLNSSRTLMQTLASVQEQNVDEPVEVLVVDGQSTDATRNIARSMGATVILCEGKLLGARRLGVERAQGGTIVLLDSDQVLRPGKLREAADAIRRGFDMVVLGERVLEPRTFLQRLSNLDKQLLEYDIDSQLDPRTGVLLPRVFTTYLLRKAFGAIPNQLDDVVIAHDHAIIYAEAFALSAKVCYVKDAVWHVEPLRLGDLLLKNYRYGWSTRELINSKRYALLVRGKTRLRKIDAASVPVHLRLASLAFLGTKGIAYFCGYLVANWRTRSSGGTRS